MKVSIPHSWPHIVWLCRTYDCTDPYTLEFLDFHRNIVADEKPKTGAADAKKDLDIFGMIMQARK